MISEPTPDWIQAEADSVPTDPKGIKEITLKLLAYCKKNDWAGYDPYDALNSRVFRSLPIRRSKMARLALTQGVKRSPFNLRPLLLIPRTHNPKGLALFTSALVKLARIGIVGADEDVSLLAERLLSLKSPDSQYYAWGYSFDWQGRGPLVLRGSPNIICTAFAANALLDAYEQVHDPVWLERSVSASDFILDILFWREGTNKACFSYTPLGRSEVHNASLLGAALLCRTSQITGQRKYIEPALEAARYSVRKQHENGSWVYGESPHQQWIDNFHTGFNLVALHRIRDYVGTEEFDDAIRRGFDFFVNNFFLENGAAKYYHNATYPIDIHSIAQSIITLVMFGGFLDKDAKILGSVIAWALANLWDKRGFFYFQKHRHYTVRTPFMRWSQAWMLLALSTFLSEECTQSGRSSPKYPGLKGKKRS